MARKIGIIDCGTNTFHLMIVSFKETGYDVVLKIKENVKIGEGGISTGKISTDAEKRALLALGQFKLICQQHKVDSILAFATSAFRNAQNGAYVKSKIQEDTGINLQIISGQWEAELIYYGVTEALNIGDEPALIMDIGGGSVEFIIGTSEEILWRKSYEIGAQRLLDLFHKHDPIRPQDIRSLESFLLERINDLIDALKLYKPKSLIGSSGTFDTLSDIYCAANDVEKQENATEAPLTIPGYLYTHQELIRKNRAERLNIPGMVEMRVDMIVVASCIIKLLMDRHAFDNIRVSTLALKEGVLKQIKEGKL